MAISRMRRVNQVLKEVIGEAVTNDLSDPRLAMLSVTSVDTAPDLRNAKVYVTVLGDEEGRQEALDALSSAHGLIQGRIASQTRMKRTPTLDFRYDEAVETGLRITAMLEAEPELEPGEESVPGFDPETGEPIGEGPGDA